MKHTLRILAAALVVACASVAQAQGGGGGGGGGAKMAERQAAARAALFEGITLTADQNLRIDSIFTASQKATAELRAGIQRRTPPSDELRARMWAVQAGQLKAVRAVLTPEQNVTFDANVAKRSQGRRGGR